MTSFAIHHGLMPMCTGQILPPDACSATILTDTSFTSVPQQPECNKSSGKYGKIQDGLEAAIRLESVLCHRKATSLIMRKNNYQL